MWLEILWLELYRWCFVPKLMVMSRDCHVTAFNEKVVRMMLRYLLVKGSKAVHGRYTFKYMSVSPHERVTTQSQPNGTLFHDQQSTHPQIT